MEHKIRVSLEAKNKLERTKKQNNFKTFSDCIETMCEFFNTNSVSPKDKILNQVQYDFANIKNLINHGSVNLQKFISDDSQSLRKRHGAIERDYFVPMSMKIEKLYDHFIGATERKKQTETIEKEFEFEIIEKKYKANINDQQRIIDDLNLHVKKRDLLIEKRDDTLAEYFKIIKTLNENVKYEKTISGKKVFINLPIDRINELFKIIP